MSKKENYLSALFLRTLNRDYSKNSILNALKQCNTEFLRKLSQSENFCLIHKQELLDFNDVFDEFENVLESEWQKEFLLLDQLKYI